MAASLLAMMILTFVDVVGRYAFRAPIFGSSEMISYLLAVTVFAGLAVVTGERNHVTIALFEGWRADRLAGTVRRMFAQGFCCAAMAALAVELFRHAGRMIADRTSTIVLEWSLWPLVAAMAAMAATGFLLALLPRPPAFRHPDAQSGGEPR